MPRWKEEGQVGAREGEWAWWSEALGRFFTGFPPFRVLEVRPRFPVLLSPLPSSLVLVTSPVPLFTSPPLSPPQP